ncbi:MAG: hypothetical protein ACTS22_09285 [Phycisphaerales bacterium]
MMLAAAGTCVAASGQDSVASSGFTDALSAYSTATQVVQYTVDVDTFISSKGKSYSIAPVVKSTLDEGGVFPNLLISGNGLSRLSGNASSFGGQYSTWSTPGAGVNPSANSGSTSLVSAPGDSVYLGLGFGDFTGRANNIIATEVGYSAANPNRLYVTRAVAAVNSSTGGVTDSAQFGFGTIDEAMNVHFRADGFGSTGSNIITGNNIFRVDAGARNAATTNLISQLGGSDAGATTGVVRGSGTTHSIPSAVPAAVGGPAYIGPNFATALVYEVSPGTTATTVAHRGAAPDHRGGIGVLPAPFVNAGDAITGAILSKDAVDATSAISVWGAGANGLPSATGIRYLTPDTIVDPLEGVSIFPDAFIHNGGSTAFRGSAQAAIGTSPNGDLLIAGTMNTRFDPTDPRGVQSQTVVNNAIVVGRIATPGGAAEWSLAGWLDVNGITQFGKQLTDAQGNVFGELADLASIPGAPVGVSMTSPSFDSQGNIYFVAPVRDYGPDGQAFTADDFVSTSVIRGNYIDDINGSFGYDLEVLFEFGDTFASAGTGLNYRITFLGFASGMTGAIQSGAFFANSATLAPVAGAVVNSSEDAATLGGLVVAAEITYDVDGDGIFVDGDPLNPDQDYQVMLFAMGQAGGGITDCNGNGVDDATDIANGTSQDVNGDGTPDECQLTRLCADVNNNGSAEPGDFTAWVAAYNGNSYLADQNSNGAVEPGDFTAWVANYNLGANGPLCVE